jgi:hypothetical protein
LRKTRHLLVIATHLVDAAIDFAQVH